MKSANQLGGKLWISLNSKGKGGEKEEEFLITGEIVFSFLHVWPRDR
jgi:hypothetical protein